MCSSKSMISKSLCLTLFSLFKQINLVCFSSLSGWNEVISWRSWRAFTAFFKVSNAADSPEKKKKKKNWKLAVICFLYTYIIIIIMSCRQHGYPWPSLATSPYHSSPPAGLQGYILCPHIVAVCKFELVVLLLHGHMWGSIGVHHLWACPCFSSSVPRVWFV